MATPEAGGLKLALVQQESRVGDKEGNIASAVSLIEEASAGGADLVVLPEFFSTGYFPLYWDYGHMELAEPEDGPTVTELRDVARDQSVHLVVTFFERDGSGTYYDTSVVLSPAGATVAKYRKTHPPARVSLEKLYYRGGSRLPVFDILGWRVGILVCYDNYLTEPARVLMTRGAELIIAPFAEVADFDMWVPVLRTRAFENGVYVGAANLVGPDQDDPKEVLGGRSVVIDPEGVVLGLGKGDAPEVVVGVLDRERLLKVRAKRQWRRDRRPELYGALSEWDEDARELRT